MKISYQVNKSSVPKKSPLEGIHRATEPSQEVVQKQRAERLKRFDPTRVVLFSILMFLVEVLVLYLINFPMVRLSVDYLRNPTSKLPTVAYRTIKVSFASEVPEALQTQIKSKLSDISHNGTKRFEFVTENPDVSLTYVKTASTSDTIISQQYLVPVGHLYWIKDGVTKSNIQQNGVIVPTGMKTLYAKILSDYAGKEVKTTEATDFLASLKSSEKIAGFTDFSNLSGSYKLLTLDNKYFFDNAPEGGIPYYFVLTGSSTVGKNVIQTRADSAFPDSFNKESLLSVRMTGVTAITRSLGIKSNAAGDPGYAARKIGTFLSKADLTHVSNEISMVPGCVPAGGVSFCMVQSQIKALKDSGVDIVELTGNHNNDKGATYNTATINAYKKLGWDYFGGGLNSTDSAKILYKDVKGTKVAFLGYNYYDTVLGTGAIATKSHAGANSWSNSKIRKDIEAARQNGADVVIVDFQYQECWCYTSDGSTVQQCYGPISAPNQKKDFRYAIDAGADIVIGTQAHQPQTYEIYKGKVIYYGLGNLYFDQTEQLGTRQGLILTHYMYKGKYMGTNITTTIFNSDLLTYVTTGSQRTSLLNSLKTWRPKN